MAFIRLFTLITIAAVIIIPFLKYKGRAIVLYAALVLNSLIAAAPAVNSLSGESFSMILSGGMAFGNVPIRIDALSGWFILIISFIFLTGTFYGIFYMKSYEDQKANLGLHCISLVLLYSSLIAITVVQNSLAFIVAWEIMTITAFITIIYEHNKPETIKAGLNFFIQSHISVLLLIIGFIWVASKTGSYDFSAITEYTLSHQGATSLALFLCFAVGFAIKAGFVPFHSWLPYAHPAAPAHISGIMSGVIIKIGIFGILRMITVIKTDYLILGYIILTFSVISGLYGVMLAIIQHNLKRLLAYHSIENIGIIGMGIGIGCIGIGNSNGLLAVLGFTGALLHTLNHALFKSLLFFTAGNVYQSTHTLEIEKLGGLIKKMPHTALLFILAAMAICGLPPFNGFISEFVIYAGFYSWMQVAQLTDLIAIIFSILGLVMIGGLAILCFTKAAGVVFLGTPRHHLEHEPKEVSLPQLIPLYIIGALIIIIGLFPQVFIRLLTNPVNLFAGNISSAAASSVNSITGIMKSVSIASAGFFALILIVLGLGKAVTRKRSTRIDSTWGCGYVAPTSKIQYTGSSYAKAYIRLFSSLLLIFKSSRDVTGVFPEETHYETKPYDKLEKWLIDKPLKAYKSFMNRFLFIQNGKLQQYILYGIVFIIAVILVPMLYDKIVSLFDFIKQL